MLIFGIILAAVGVISGTIGFALHLNNMRNLVNGDADNLSGGKVVAPFAFIGVGSVSATIGVIIVIIALVLTYLV